MNPYLVFILAAMALRLCLEVLADFFNIRNLRLAAPEALRDIYDEAQYRRSQEYLRINTRFSIFQDLLCTAILVAFILWGGFGRMDTWARGFGFGPIPTGLLFTAALFLLGRLLHLPFALVDTFVIEERFGFNRTTIRTFCFDMVKSLLIVAILGGPIYVAILWLFAHAGHQAWLWVWITVTAFQLLLTFLAPSLLMPLFNKFSPLPEGELRTALESYARQENFAMRGVYVMDGSRRSAKANAFFTGFGRARRIVLFDTLVENHTIPELIGILAHEMGHFKKRHVLQAMARSILLTGTTLFLLSRFLNNPTLTAAFGVATPSVYTALVFFSFLYAPITLLVGVIENAISRRHEYAADAYAARTTRTAAPLIDALKKLNRDNLSNRTPHPLKVFLEYSHPPLLARITAMRSIQS